MNNLRTIGELVRIIDVILIAGAVVAGGYFGAGSLRFDLFIAALGAGLIAAGGYVINDWCDEKIDQINKPHRPLPSGRISKPQALLLAFILQLVGFIPSLWLTYPAVWIALLWVVFVNLYSFVLQNIPLIGNMTTAFMLAMTFVYGSVTVGNSNNIWSLVTFIFLGNVSREIIKDIEDIPGDSLNNVKTLAVWIGPAKAAAIAAALFIMAITPLFDRELIAFFNDIYFWLVFLVVVPMTLILAIRCLQTRGACAAWARTWSKAIYGIMLVAVAVGMINKIP